MTTSLILLPPSEGKAGGGDGDAWDQTNQSFHGLADHRNQVIAALHMAMGDSSEARSKLLGVGAAKTEEATAANLNIYKAPTLPAIERYTGVLYDALDYSSLPAETRIQVDRQAVIFSGVWGVVRPPDRVPDYKLKMGASLPPLGRLAKFWKPVLTETLEGLAAGTVWDLLPNEHAAAWNPAVAGNRIRVRFLDDVEKNGERKLVAVSHWNKLLKGALVRHIVEQGLDDPEGLIDFDHPEGYNYDRTLTVTEGNTSEVSIVARR